MFHKTREIVAVRVPGRGGLLLSTDRAILVQAEHELQRLNPNQWTKCDIRILITDNPNRPRHENPAASAQTQIMTASPSTGVANSLPAPSQRLGQQARSECLSLHCLPLHGGQVYLDKAYADERLAQATRADQDLALLTLVKKAKDQAYLEAADLGWSAAVSRVRRPLNSFNWIEENTRIQRASKVVG